MTATEFATNIIEGAGGLADFEERESPTWPHGERVGVVLWTLRCLANPDCQGSEQAVAAILARRARRARERDEGAAT